MFVRLRFLPTELSHPNHKTLTPPFLFFDTSTIFWFYFLLFSFRRRFLSKTYFDTFLCQSFFDISFLFCTIPCKTILFYTFPKITKYSAMVITGGTNVCGQIRIKRRISRRTMVEKATHFC